MLEWEAAEAASPDVDASLRTMRWERSDFSFCQLLSGALSRLINQKQRWKTQAMLFFSVSALSNVHAKSP